MPGYKQLKKIKHQKTKQNKKNKQRPETTYVGAFQFNSLISSLLVINCTANFIQQFIYYILKGRKINPHSMILISTYSNHLKVYYNSLLPAFLELCLLH